MSEVHIEPWRPEPDGSAPLQRELEMLGDVLRAVVYGIVGTVTLDLGTPPNQRHRAEVAKLLVHPVARRRGIARALMIALEAVARAEGRTLLTLDTWTGREAESLYRSLGYVVAGVIPRYARGSLTPELEGTTIMYKDL